MRFVTRQSAVTISVLNAGLECEADRVTMSAYTARNTIKELRELNRWRNWSGPVFMLALVIGFLFGVWLAAKVNGPVTIRGKGNAGPAVELGTAPAEEPNMMTVSLVHRFRFQNKS
jgi:hypothetical protein